MLVTRRAILTSAKERTELSCHRKRESEADASFGGSREERDGRSSPALPRDTRAAFHVSRRFLREIARFSLHVPIGHPRIAAIISSRREPRHASGIGCLFRLGDLLISLTNRCPQVVRFIPPRSRFSSGKNLLSVRESAEFLILRRVRPRTRRCVSLRPLQESCSNYSPTGRSSLPTYARSLCAVLLPRALSRSRVYNTAEPAVRDAVGFRFYYSFERATLYYYATLFATYTRRDAPEHASLCERGATTRGSGIN